MPLPHAPSKAPRWTDEEEALLRKHYADGTLEELAALLPDREPHAIEGKASRMELRKSDAYRERMAREGPIFSYAHCLACHGRMDLDRQNVCDESPKKTNFIIAQQGGGRGSGFHDVEAQCFTLEAALANDAYRPLALAYIARVQKLAEQLKRLAPPGPAAPEPPTGPAGRAPPALPDRGR